MGDTSDRKKIHLIKWHKVCKSKDNEGLRLEKAKLQNTAVLSNLGWNMQTKNPKNHTLLIDVVIGTSIVSISHIINDQTRNDILNIHLTRYNRAKDCHCWAPVSNGLFSVASAHELLNHEDGDIT